MGVDGTGRGYNEIMSLIFFMFLYKKLKNVSCEHDRLNG